MVTSTTVHDQRRRSALNVVGVPLVEKRGAPSDRSVVKDGRGVHVHRILKRVQKHISKTLNFPQLPWPLTTAYSKLQHLTAPYNIIGTRSVV